MRGTPEAARLPCLPEVLFSSETLELARAHAQSYPRLTSYQVLDIVGDKSFKINDLKHFRQTGWRMLGALSAQMRTVGRTDF